MDCAVSMAYSPGWSPASWSTCSARCRADVLLDGARLVGALRAAPAGAGTDLGPERVVRAVPVQAPEGAEGTHSFG